MASPSERSIYQNRAFWLVPERSETNSTDRSDLAGQSLTSFSLYSIFLKNSVLWTALKFEMSVSEENPNVFFYNPEEDNVLGQHETSLNETDIEEIRDVTANCFCFCYIINSLLTELVRSIQEGTAGLVLFSLVCGPRLRLGPKKAKKRTRPCSILLYGPLAQSITYIYYMAKVDGARWLAADRSDIKRIDRSIRFFNTHVGPLK